MSNLTMKKYTVRLYERDVEAIKKAYDPFDIGHNHVIRMAVRQVADKLRAGKMKGPKG